MHVLQALQTKWDYWLLGKLKKRKEWHFYNEPRPLPLTTVWFNAFYFLKKLQRNTTGLYEQPHGSQMNDESCEQNATQRLVCSCCWYMTWRALHQRCHIIMSATYFRRNHFNDIGGQAVKNDNPGLVSMTNEMTRVHSTMAQKVCNFGASRCKQFA